MKQQVKLKQAVKLIKPDKKVMLPGEFGCMLELTVHKPNGEVTEHRIVKSKSFVRQFLEILWMQCYNLPSVLAGGTRPKDTGGTARGVDHASGNLSAVADAGITANGIVVGTGTAAVTVDDYKLQTLITHGGAAGQLQYSAMTFGAPAEDGTTSQFRLTRDFSNASGATITVNEIGLDVIASGYYFMAIRDVITPVDVPNGEILTINYEEQATI